MKRFNKVPDAGANANSDVAHVDDLMTNTVIAVTRHQTIDHARELMTRHGIHAAPVINKEQEPVGVLTSMDLIGRPAGETLVGQVMTREVYTIPRYSGIHLAARMMRNHKIHHLLVTHEKKVAGIVSSFDLLKLIEDRRFVMKSQPTRTRKGVAPRRKEEEQPGS